MADLGLIGSAIEYVCSLLVLVCRVKLVQVHCLGLVHDDSHYYHHVNVGELSAKDNGCDECTIGSNA